MQNLEQLKKSRILITGASSMIGRHLVKNLKERGYENLVWCPHIKELDLGIEKFRFVNLTCAEDVYSMFSELKPDYVFNLAGYNGNISFSQKYPANIFDDTATIALNCLSYAQSFYTKKCVNILSSCAIADLGDKKLKAEELWNGPPNPTIEAHGFAKRIWDAYSRQLYKQFGFNSVCAIMNNCYGEYDNTDIEKTKAVMGIIKRIVEAKRNGAPSIECWGTGEVFREFVYAKDAANALIDVMENYDNPMCPINISTKDEISIYDLTMKIAKIVGYTGEIHWDINKPDGQKRKSLDISNMRDYVKSEFTPIDIGLENTIKWYTENY